MKGQLKIYFLCFFIGLLCFTNAFSQNQHAHLKFQRFGVDVHRYYVHESNEAKLLRRYEVDAIFDIGANIGQSVTAFRAGGFMGSIVSFEPVSHLFTALVQMETVDKCFHAESIALGATEGVADIQVSGGHAGASSLLPMTEIVRINAPDQIVVRSESIRVSTVDAMSAKYYPTGDRLFLKIDAQGYEKFILDGAKNSLPRVIGMRLELALVHTYEGESLLHELLPVIYAHGFRVVAFDSAWGNDHTAEIYQVNVTCFRTGALNATDTTA